MLFLAIFRPFSSLKIILRSSRHVRDYSCSKYVTLILKITCMSSLVLIFKVVPGRYRYVSLEWPKKWIFALLTVKEGDLNFLTTFSGFFGQKNHRNRSFLKNFMFWRLGPKGSSQKVTSEGSFLSFEIWPPNFFWTRFRPFGIVSDNFWKFEFLTVFVHFRGQKWDFEFGTTFIVDIRLCTPNMPIYVLLTYRYILPTHPLSV